MGSGINLASVFVVGKVSYCNKTVGRVTAVSYKLDRNPSCLLLNRKDESHPVISSQITVYPELNEVRNSFALFSRRSDTLSHCNLLFNLEFLSSALSLDELNLLLTSGYYIFHNAKLRIMTQGAGETFEIMKIAGSLLKNRVCGRSSG